MVRSAWIRRTGPGASRCWPSGCSRPPRSAHAVTRGPRPPAPAGAVPAPWPFARPAAADASAVAPWFRLDPVLDAGGALAGQRLVVGRGDRRDHRVLDLDPESFAAGPFGTVVLVGTDDGSRSRLLALDVAGGCVSTVDAVDRHHPSGDAHARRPVGPGVPAGSSNAGGPRASGADRWTRTGAPTRLVAADRAGRAVRAHLVDGAHLVAGRRGPRDPVLRRGRPVGRASSRLATGRLRLVDDADLGPAIGLADGRLVAYLACRGCPARWWP